MLDICCCWPICRSGRQQAERTAENTDGHPHPAIPDPQSSPHQEIARLTDAGAKAPRPEEAVASQPGPLKRNDPTPLSLSPSAQPAPDTLPSPRTDLNSLELDPFYPTQSLNERTWSSETRPHDRAPIDSCQPRALSSIQVGDTNTISNSEETGPIASIKDNGRMFSWEDRERPLRIKIRTVAKTLGVEESIDIPASGIYLTKEEAYNRIVSTSKAIKEFLPHPEKGDSTLSLLFGSCSLVFGESDTRLLGRKSDLYKLEDFQDWVLITAAVLNYQQTLLNFEELNFTITRAVGFIDDLGMDQMRDPGDVSWLAMGLKSCQKSTPGHTTRKYIPKEDIEKHTRFEVIMTIINHDPKLLMTTQQRNAFAREVYSKAPKLFLMFIKGLVSLNLLSKCLEDGLSDETSVLPPEPSSLNKGIPRDRYTTDENYLWNEFIYPIQWEFNAASFLVVGKHQELSPEVIIPILEKEVCGEGAFSRVYSILLEPSHQKLYSIGQNKNPKLALKQLFRRPNCDAVFLGEAVVLKGVSELDHPHIIKLLATYVQDDNHSFIFPLASCNLEHYMEQVNPPKSRRYLVWIYNQIRGMATGLRCIHSLENERAEKNINLASSRLEVPGVSNRTNSSSYHHDLKPSNILLFYEIQEQIETPSPELGIFQIADFGVGKIHQLLPQEKLSKYTRTPRGTPTYQAPESRIKDKNGELHISRPYDVWAFGCILMEMCTWIVLGPQGWRKFNEDRVQPIDSTRFEWNDSFFYIRDAGNGTPGQTAEVRGSVQDQMERLRNLQSTETGLKSLHMLVDLAEKILNVNPLTRMKASDVVQELDLIIKCAETEENQFPDCDVKRITNPQNPVIQINGDVTGDDITDPLPGPSKLPVIQPEVSLPVKFSPVNAGSGSTLIPPIRVNPPNIELEQTLPQPIDSASSHDAVSVQTQSNRMDSFPTERGSI